MNKRMRELKALIEFKIKEARALMSGENKDVERAEAIMNDVDSLQKELDLETKLFEAEKEEAAEEAEEKVEEKAEKNATADFAKAARAGFPKAMSEGTNADGGYTVPEDIVTRIERYRDAKFSLRQLVRVVSVSTKSGARTFKQRKDRTGFAKVLENGKFQAGVTPQFERLTYSISKYGGYFVMTDELREDSDENIANIIIEDIGDEARITDNVQILSAITTGINKTDLEDIDGIKEAVNVTLGQAFADTATIVTNDNGLQYLDTLADGNGNALLKASPLDPLKRFVAIGFRQVPLVVVPNADLANFTVSDASVIPFIIGDFQEGVVLWDRRQITLLQSNVAAVTDYNAFEQGGTIIRADMRADYTLRDAQALVVGYIDPNAD